MIKPDIETICVNFYKSIPLKDRLKWSFFCFFSTDLNIEMMYVNLTITITNPNWTHEDYAEYYDIPNNLPY